jgi:hypothetical protein
LNKLLAKIPPTLNYRNSVVEVVNLRDQVSSKGFSLLSAEALTTSDRNRSDVSGECNIILEFIHRHIHPDSQNPNLNV